MTGRGAVYDVESDVDSQSTGNSDSSTPIMGRKGERMVSNDSDESGSANSISLFRVNTASFSLQSVCCFIGNTGQFVVCFRNTK